MPAPAEIPIEELASMPTEAIWMRFARDPIGLARCLCDALLPVVTQIMAEDAAKSENKTLVIFAALEREGCLPGMRTSGGYLIDHLHVSPTCVAALKKSQTYTFTGQLNYGGIDRERQGRTVKFPDWFAHQIPVENIEDTHARCVVRQLLADGELRSRYLLLVVIMIVARHAQALALEAHTASA